MTSSNPEAFANKAVTLEFFREAASSCIVLQNLWFILNNPVGNLFIQIIVFCPAIRN